MDTFRLTFYKIYQLIVKELLTTLKDPKSRVILVIPVLVQGLLFGYTATYNLDNVPYALVDEDHSRESADFIAHLDGTGIFQRVQTLSSTQQIAQAIDSGEAMIVITIPSDFARRLNSGQEAPIQTVTDGRNPMTAGLAASYAASIVSAMNVQRSGHQPLIEIRSRIWYNPNNITRRMFLPSLIPMLALTQVLILAGLSVARERENGTFDQLLVTPLTPPEILIGKAVPPILIGLVQATLMFCIAVFWFKIQLVGSLAALYLTIFIFLVSCVGLGLSISAVAKNMQQVMVYCFLFLMPMILLSGLATPVRNMPQVLQYVTYINPMRFAIEAIRRIYLEGAGIPVIAYTYLPMLAVAAVTLLLPVNDLSYTPEECTLPEEEQNKAFPIQTEEQYQLENTESIRQQKQTLLVVDDDTEVAHYLKALLSPVYNVVCRFDADSAFKAMSEEAPDLVLSDVVMPGRNGYDLCRQIKEDLQLCHIPVILVTAKATVENQVEGLNTGADAYVTKPFEPNYLLALIKSQLKNREKVRSLLSRSTQTDEIEENVLSPQDNTFMTELYHLMENELSNPELDVARMTELLKISRTKFYYKVKGLTGENPSVFFKTYKLNRAAKLIKEGKYTISEIADMTGFSTLSHFSTSFKKQFGATPSEYSK